jgi:hypothetical protein
VHDADSSIAVPLCKYFVCSVLNCVHLLISIAVQLYNYFVCSVLNCVRLLTRVLPYIFEDPDWRGFFWSTLPGQSQDEAAVQSMPLAQSLITAICVREWKIHLLI